MKNMPNVEIANWIAGQRRLRQRIRQRKMTNITACIVLTKEEAELQIVLDERFRNRIIDATSNIATMLPNVANAVNNNNNNNKEIDQDPSNTTPPEEDPPD